MNVYSDDEDWSCKYCDHYTDNSQTRCANCSREKNSPFKKGDLVEFFDGFEWTEGKIIEIALEEMGLKYKINQYYYGLDEIRSSEEISVFS